MDTYQGNNPFDVEIQEADKQMGLISLFHCEAEGAFDIQIPTTDDPFSLIINLGPASDSYLFNGIPATLPMGYFNIFHVASDTLRWRFKEGMNNFIVLRIKETWMRELCDGGPFEEFMKCSGNTTSASMNGEAHPLIPIMDNDLVTLLSNSFKDGVLRAMRRQASSYSLVMCAMKTSELFVDGRLTHADTIEVRRVCNYLPSNINKIKSKDDFLSLSAMNDNDFERVFDLMYRINVSEFLMRERFKIAEPLLMFSSRTINAIAKAAGFQTTDDLIAAFEDRYSLGPEEFRANVRN